MFMPCLHVRGSGRANGIYNHQPRGGAKTTYIDTKKNINVFYINTYIHNIIYKCLNTPPEKFLGSFFF